MVLNNLITEEIYNIKKAEIEKEMKSAIVEIQLHEQVDSNFKDCLITAFQLASRLHDIFLVSKNCEKREIINFVFSKLELTGKTLGYSLRCPFDLMVENAGCDTWLPELDTVLTSNYSNVVKFNRKTEEVMGLAA